MRIKIFCCLLFAAGFVIGCSQEKEPISQKEILAQILKNTKEVKLQVDPEQSTLLIEDPMSPSKAKKRPGSEVNLSIDKIASQIVITDSVGFIVVTDTVGFLDVPGQVGVTGLGVNTIIGIAFDEGQFICQEYSDGLLTRTQGVIGVNLDVTGLTPIDSFPVSQYVVSPESQEALVIFDVAISPPSEARRYSTLNRKVCIYRLEGKYWVVEIP